MTHFRHRYPPVHIERKRAVQLQKFALQKLDLTNFLIKLLIHLGRKYHFHFTCERRGLFVRSVAIYWRLKIGPKLLSSLACSRRSDSGARAKNIASERAGKNEGKLGKRTREPASPRFFLLFRSLYFSLALHYLNAWNRLFRPLSPFFTVNRLLVTGDTPTATAVCGFRHADGISLDA